jgi:hypothetical protein
MLQLVRTLEVSFLELAARYERHCPTCDFLRQAPG